MKKYRYDVVLKHNGKKIVELSSKGTFAEITKKIFSAIAKINRV